MKTTAPATVPPVQPPLKTLLFTSGGKGGPGKTVNLLGIADWLAVRGRAFIALDCDHENKNKKSSFANAFPEGMVGRPDLRTEEACDKLLEVAAASEPGLTLADLPANSGADFLAWWRKVCTPENLAALNLRVIMVGVITPETSTFDSVLDWAEVLQGSVSYVLGLNRRHVSRAEQPIEEVLPDYFASEEGRAFRAAFHPVEIEIPAMQEKAMAAMLASGQLPSVAASRPGIFVLDQTRIRSWVAQLHANLDAAEPTLHLLN